MRSWCDSTTLSRAMVFPLINTCRLATSGRVNVSLISSTLTMLHRFLGVTGVCVYLPNSKGWRCQVNKHVRALKSWSKPCSSNRQTNYSRYSGIFHVIPSKCYRFAQEVKRQSVQSLYLYLLHSRRFAQSRQYTEAMYNHWVVGIAANAGPFIQLQRVHQTARQRHVIRHVQQVRCHHCCLQSGRFVQTVSDAHVILLNVQ